MKRILAYINDDATSTGKALIGAYRASEADAALEKEVYEKEKCIAREAETRADLAKADAEIARLKKLSHHLVDELSREQGWTNEWTAESHAEIDGGGK